MPETPFTVQLPDGSKKVCYSPSSVVCEYFTVGDVLPASEFLSKARKALNEASARVEAKFGFACSGATNSLAMIESWGAELTPEDSVTITHI